MFLVSRLQIAVEDAIPGPNATALWVATDRTQGGSSSVDGSVEVCLSRQPKALITLATLVFPSCVQLMVHRRLLYDDNRGVNEPLNEPGVAWGGGGLNVRGTHRLGLDPVKSAAAARRGAAQDVSLFGPLFAFADTDGATPLAWANAHRTTFSGVASPLPPNVHLLTTHSTGPGSLLVRLAHIFAAGEDTTLSANVTVALGGLFSGLAVTDAVETTLPASLPAASGLRGVAWAAAGFPVTLGPMEVRTFNCTTMAL